MSEGKDIISFECVIFVLYIQCKKKLAYIVCRFSDSFALTVTRTLWCVA